MQQPDFILGYLPFWIVNYGLAIVIWSCVGRWLLSFFLPQIQPKNYIWRAFVMLTEWAVRAASWITPSMIRPGWLPLIAAFWLYWIRILLFFLFHALGMTPSVTVGG
jgi:hypothetical protein